MTSLRGIEAYRSRLTWTAAAEDSVTTAEQPGNHLETFEMEQEALPQTDGGKTAWLILAACSLIQVPVWGFSIAFGIFQEYFFTAPGLLGDKSSVANIGTATTGILYLSSPLTFTLLTLYPSLRRWFGPVGLLVLSGSFLASAFTRRVWQLVALQGVGAGLGAGLLFAQSTLCLDERFARRKGLAYGIMWAGKSATGVGLPFAVAGGLDRFGYRTTMLTWTVAVIAITAPLLLALQPVGAAGSSTSTLRTNNSTTAPNSGSGRSSTATAPRDSASPSAGGQQQQGREEGRRWRRRRLDALPLLRSRSFWALQTGNVLQSLGYFLPAAYLPSYATQELALPAHTGALLLALLNATSILGGILIGALCDRVRSTRRVLLVSALPSAGAVLLFWGLAGPRGGGGNRDSGTGAAMTSNNNNASPPASSGGSSSVALLVVFALAYGFFAGGFSSTWGGVLRELGREHPTLDTGFAFGLLAGGRGVGNVVSGPISVALIASTRAAQQRNAAAGGDHGGEMMGGAGGEGGVNVVVSGGLAAAAGAYGSAYGPMILFTGISALFGAWGWVCQSPSASRSPPQQQQSSTSAFLGRPSSWRRWCQRAALLCRLAIPAPHWRRQQRP